MIKEKLANFWKKIKLLHPAIWIGLFAVLIFGSTCYYSIKYPYIKPPQEVSNKKTVPTQTPTENKDLAAAKAEIRKNPPKLSSSGSSTTIGDLTIVSDGTLSQDDINKLQGYAGSGPAGNITYNDTTGAYPALGDVLISYIRNTLLYKGSDISRMYEIKMVDCLSCGYAGLYSGSYMQDGSDITQAFGFITLNVYYYKSSPYFLDYMKLILSHEYGHHYTLYHRWVDLDIPWGERFPDAYYNIRPLTKATTATDYSLGWGNCDAEIIAEDYSYFYSTYGMHAMAGSYGLPGGATNSWIRNMSVETPVPEDSQAPTVAITSPSNGATVSGVITVSADASDNIGVTRVEFYLDGSIFATAPTPPYLANLSTGSYSNGSHTLVAKAYDAYQSGQSSITINISNAADNEPPVVSITEPPSNPYNWSSGDLIVEASATDNVGVVKIEFYINGTKVAEEAGGYIIRLWLNAGTPAGSYSLKAKAYDNVGNTGESTITINKS